MAGEKNKKSLFGRVGGALGFGASKPKVEAETALPSQTSSAATTDDESTRPSTPASDTSEGKQERKISALQDQLGLSFGVRNEPKTINPNIAVFEARIAEIKADKSLGWEAKRDQMVVPLMQELDADRSLKYSEREALKNKAHNAAAPPPPPPRPRQTAEEKNTPASESKVPEAPQSKEDTRRRVLGDLADRPNPFAAGVIAGKDLRKVEARAEKKHKPVGGVELGISEAVVKGALGGLKRVTHGTKPAAKSEELSELDRKLQARKMKEDLADIKRDDAAQSADVDTKPSGPR